MQIKTLFKALLILCLFNSGCHIDNSPNDSLTVYVAAGANPVVEELAHIYKASYGTDVVLNTASSGTLARQIRQGGQCDVYISASQEWIKHIEKEEMASKSDEVQLSLNSLVLITSYNYIPYHKNIMDLPGITEGYIAIGDPDHVPAGKYALQSMLFNNLYQHLEKNLLPCKDVRSALMMVEMGECSYGIVYKTDALKSDKVLIVTDFSAQSHDPVIFSGTIISTSLKNDEARRFLQFASSEETCSIWEKHGFSQPQK